MQTSWLDRNLGRRFWSCPHYEAMNCNFFLWRDKERVDERSRFILLKLVNMIKELEENYERVKMQYWYSLIIPSLNSPNKRKFLWMKVKEKGGDVKETCDLKQKKMKMKKKDEVCRCFGKFLCCLMICFVVIFVSFLIQVGRLKD
ncbi:hypothetical protein R3W88_029443 [Solanum pinnatisectum]|uniref:GRF-type domain-containing protein n=1 Tax=Solanum pinnatisectum TaxID=50273 RepID=A0AAV9K5E0_9SOLN|nr:hypothetical protein R3W88_029443 [Solanum pinnatisectum]